MSYPFLSFGEPVIFSTAPELIDVEWNPPKDKEDVSDDEQMNFFDL